MVDTSGAVHERWLMIRRCMEIALGSALVFVTLVACSADLDGGPERVAEIDITTDRDVARAVLPPGAQSVSVISVDGTPRAVDDLFVGTLFPRDDRSDLAFVAFDDMGTRWSLSTNPSCAGWAPTRASDGTNIVVALNSDARVEDGVLAENTLASGFSAKAGTKRWGSKPVIGPILANGALFTGAQKAILSEEPTETQILSPDDGAAVEPPGEWLNAHAIHEHFGIVLLAQDGRVAAMDSASGSMIWESASPGEFLGESSAGHAVSFRSINDPERLSIVNLATGEIIADDVLQVHAATSSDGHHTAVTMTHEAGQIVSLVGDSGMLWSRSVSAETELRAASVGAGKVYLASSGENIVLASDNGSELARGPFAAPIAVTSSGYGLVPTDDSRVYELVRLEAL